MTSKEETPPADEGRGLSEGLGAGAGANEDPRAYFSRTLLEAAVMTPEQEALVLRNACPKCRERLARNSEGGGMRFSQCIGCGDIWVVCA